jgi:predicted DNA-binding transcriptional regulator AlpA
VEDQTVPLKRRLRSSAAAVEPVKPPQPAPPKDRAPPLSRVPDVRGKLSATDQAAANELRSRQRRGLLRKRALDREGRADRPERFLTWPDLFERGLISSKTQARRMWEQGLFPKPVHLSERVIAFRESEVDAWAATRSTEWEVA